MESASACESAASVLELSERTGVWPAPMFGAKEAVRVGVEIAGSAGQPSAAGEATTDIGEPPHEPRDPEREVGDRHPDAADASLFEHGAREAENTVLRVVIGERLFQDLDKEGESAGARVINRLGEGRVENLEQVETDKLLLRLFNVAGTNEGGGLERPPKAAARLGRGLGHASDLSQVTGEERDDLVGLVNGPRAKNDSFSLMSDHEHDGRGIARHVVSRENGRVWSPASLGRRRHRSPDRTALAAVVAGVLFCKLRPFSGRSSPAKMAETGHTGTHAPQSMHSTGSMKSWSTSA